MKKTLTPEQRRKQFRDLFESIKVPNADGYGAVIARVREVCKVLHCSETTVRIWLNRQEGVTTRAIPEAKLKILQAALGKSV